MYKIQAHTEEYPLPYPQIRDWEQPGRENKSEDKKRFNSKPAGHKQSPLTNANQFFVLSFIFLLFFLSLFFSFFFYYSPWCES